MKWQTISVIVDINTGEIITKEAVKRKEYILTGKKEKTISFKEYLNKGYYGEIIKIGIKTYTHWAKENPQQKLSL